MHKTLKNLFYLCLALSCATNANVSLFSGVNSVEFYESANNKSFVGNGFLIEYNNDIYAVTVKHALLEMKSDKLTSVATGDAIKSWKIHPNNNPQESVTLGRLLNENSSEELDMKILQKDWLIFEIEENNSSLPVLKLRTSKIDPQETLTAYGCTYKLKQTCVQQQYQGEFLGYDTHNLRVQIPNLDLSSLRGLSGSPVLDNNHQLVGIVSNVLPSKTSDGFDFAPARLDYLIQTLESLN